EIQIGLTKSKKVLGVLENLVGDNSYLCGSALSLADIHLAQMVDYFQEAREGSYLLSEHSSLSAWWSMIKENENFISTRPMLSELPD
ncbi:MAG: glutathione S-transferase family protein, partial [Gammaproteobacteria bacterium]|nr:glutathione S-transferase family protein [Gammaproteobacteria bacterium]